MKKHCIICGWPEDTIETYLYCRKCRAKREFEIIEPFGKGLKVILSCIVVTLMCIFMFALFGFFRCLNWAIRYLSIAIVSSGILFATDSYNEEIEHIIASDLIFTTNYPGVAIVFDTYITNRLTVGGIFGKIHQTVLTNWSNWQIHSANRIDLFTLIYIPNTIDQLGTITTNTCVIFTYKGKEYTNIIESTSETFPSQKRTIVDDKRYLITNFE